jgi:hypothetical protein
MLKRVNYSDVGKRSDANFIVEVTRLITPHENLGLGKSTSRPIRITENIYESLIFLILTSRPISKR